MENRHLFTSLQAEEPRSRHQHLTWSSCCNPMAKGRGQDGRDGRREGGVERGRSEEREVDTSYSLLKLSLLR